MANLCFCFFLMPPLPPPPSTTTSAAATLANKKNVVDPKISIKIISALLEKFSFLKPEHVSHIEKSLMSNDFERITLEYNHQNDYRRGKSFRKSLSTKKKMSNHNNNKKNGHQSKLSTKKIFL